MPRAESTKTREAQRRAWLKHWGKMSDTELMRLRLCDLKLEIQGTWLEGPIGQLYEELKARNLRLRPHMWLSEEWFCPDGIPGIAIPFYLAHPRLMKLERRTMLEVEGGKHAWCMKLLRHECGHAVQHAFRLHRRRRWQKVFGSSSQKYPQFYQPRPTSKDHVLHLYLWYAQSHPDEDFAETFAVWLRPGSAWRRRYAGWPALRKLEYLDALMQELQGTVPPVRSRRRVDSLPTLRKTLGEYYGEKRERFTVGAPDIYDRDLQRLFRSPGDRAPFKRRGEAASAFLRRHRREIRQTVAKWTGETQYTLDRVFADMIDRCQELGLRARGAERQLKLDFAILLTVRTMQYLYTARERLPL